jgi:hypothetical protein
LVNIAKSLCGVTLLWIDIVINCAGLADFSDYWEKSDRMTLEPPSPPDGAITSQASIRLHRKTNYHQKTLARMTEQGLS